MLAPARVLAGLAGPADLIPAAVVTVVLLAAAIALVLTARRGIEPETDATAEPGAEPAERVGAAR